MLQAWPLPPGSCSRFGVKQSTLLVPEPSGEGAVKMGLMGICPITYPIICSTAVDLWAKFSPTASPFLVPNWTVALGFHTHDGRLGLGYKGHPLEQEPPVGLSRAGE